LNVVGCTQELEAERVELMEGVMSNKRKMQELEANLLHKLTSTEVILFALLFFFSCSKRLKASFSRFCILCVTILT